MDPGYRWSQGSGPTMAPTSEGNGAFVGGPPGVKSTPSAFSRNNSQYQPPGAQPVFYRMNSNPGRGSSDTKRLSGADPVQQLSALPAALQGALAKDKKPFTYTPGGIDLSEIRSPQIQRRMQANLLPDSEERELGLREKPVQVHMPQRPENVVGTQPPGPQGHEQVARQIEGLNLAGSKTGGPAPPPPPPPPPEFGTASLPRNFLSRQRSTEQQPKDYTQSKSFKVLQKVVGTDQDQSEVIAPVHSPVVDQEELRMKGLRHGSEHVPSRSFKALQKMTGPDNIRPYTSPQQQPQYPIPPPQAFLSQRNQPFNQQQQNNSAQYGQINQSHLGRQGSHNQQNSLPDQSGVEENEGPVDIRYTGGNIPSRSFRILQEMTGEDPNSSQAPSVWQSTQQQVPVRKISRVQVQQQRDHAPSPPPAKQFPQPEVPASQQALEAEPRKYSGARIPSHSFRMLQAMTGDTNPYRDDEEGTDF